MIDRISLSSMSRKTKVLIILVALFVTFLFSDLFALKYGAYVFGMATRDWVLLFLVCLLVTIPLHEGLHGLFFHLFGGRVSFGAKMWTAFGLVFWASSDKLYTRKQFTIISLAPQILTLILLPVVIWASLPVMWEMGLFIIAVGNLCGGGFDIYISLKLKRFPAGYMYQDTKDGLNVYCSVTT